MMVIEVSASLKLTFTDPLLPILPFKPVATLSVVTPEMSGPSLRCANTTRCVAYKETELTMK